MLFVDHLAAAIGLLTVIGCIASAFTGPRDNTDTTPDDL